MIDDRLPDPTGPHCLNGSLRENSGMRIYGLFVVAMSPQEVCLSQLAKGQAFRHHHQGWFGKKTHVVYSRGEKTLQANSQSVDFGWSSSAQSR